MNIYKKKQLWKVFLLIGAFIIAFTSLLYTNSLVERLANEESKKEIADSNREVTENLVYKSKDASGNLYLLESKFGRTDEKNKNIILLDKVTAKIKLVDKPEITIKADYAEYDYDSLNTKFFDNVNIKYNTNFITSDNLDLIFNKNIANMYNNVFFNNKTSKAKADLISMNFLTGNINIQMYEKKEKIKINKE